MSENQRAERRRTAANRKTNNSTGEDKATAISTRVRSEGICIYKVIVFFLIESMAKQRLIDAVADCDRTGARHDRIIVVWLHRRASRDKILMLRHDTVSAPSRLLPTRTTPNSETMTNDLQAVITASITRAPEWIRQELLSKEKAARARAEEALAAMIAGALQQSNNNPSAS